MIVENLAERLFCDLKNAGVKIEKPEYAIDGAKVGQISSVNGIVTEPAKQFTIFGAKRGETYVYCFGHGPAVQFPNSNQSFTEAYTELLKAIKLLENLKFYSLLIPRKGVVEVKLEEFETVVSRYIKDYLPNCDEMLWRWDFLVSKVHA